MQERVDSLTFQVSLKDKEISNLKLEKLNLAKRNTGLKDHIRDVEGELTANKSVMHALKEQIEYFKRRAAQTDAAEEELSKMKRKLENYRKYFDFTYKIFAYKFIQYFLNHNIF